MLRLTTPIFYVFLNYGERLVTSIGYRDALHPPAA